MQGSLLKRMSKVLFIALVHAIFYGCYLRRNYPTEGSILYSLSLVTSILTGHKINPASMQYLVIVTL